MFTVNQWGVLCTLNKTSNPVLLLLLVKTEGKENKCIIISSVNSEVKS